MSFFQKLFKKSAGAKEEIYIAPATFLNPNSTLGELDFHLISEGRHERLWDALGAKILGPIGDQKISEVATWGQLPAGVQVSRGEVLFPRLPEPENA